MATKGSSLSAAKSTVAAYMAMVIISPCAKFTTRTTPKITERPSAISPYTRPVRIPETTTLATKSSAGKKESEQSSGNAYAHRLFQENCSDPFLQVFL